MAYESEHYLGSGLLNNSYSTANLLADGVRMVGSLGSADDLDFFKIVSDSAGLITLTFSTSVFSSSSIWNISLLDSAGKDYLLSPTRTFSSSPQVDGAEQADNTLNVKGLSSLPAAGTRFTISTSLADTVIYTVVSSTALSSGTSTLTLDKAVSTPTDGAYLIFDPVQAVTGSTATLSAMVDAAGSYYLKVAKADVASNQEYSVVSTFTGTLETDYNDVKADAKSTGNYLHAGLWMTGNLSDNLDKDVWLFTTATPSDFSIDFSAATGSAATNDWKVTVTDWNGTAIVDSVGTAISMMAGTSASSSVTAARNPTAKTYVVTVEAARSSVSTADYKLKVSGTSLDLNDTPTMTIGTVTSAASNTPIATGVVKSVKSGADAWVLMSSLFTASDADSSQTLSYIVQLVKPGGSGSTGYISYVDGETTKKYGFGTSMTESSTTISLTAAQMATAKFYSGSTTGDLTLDLQAKDSSGASDGSDSGAIMSQTLRTVGSEYSVSVVSNTGNALLEGDSSSRDTLTISLGTAPAAEETVTVYLEHGSEQPSAYQLSYSSSVLTFTQSSYSAQVTVTAREDNTKETSQTGALSFRVVSSKSGSSFNDLLVDSLTYNLTDASNHAPTGSVSVTGTPTQGQKLTASNTLADSDGIGTITYTWQQSTDKSSWSTISGSGTGNEYTLVNAQVGKYIRVLAGYRDEAGNDESVASAVLQSSGADTTIANVNDAPALTSAIADQTAIHGSAFSFRLPSGTFSDVDTGDTLTYTATLSDGSALPSWLAFSPSTKTFSSTNVTPVSGATIDVKVTATDGSNASANDTFRITVATAPTGTPVLATPLADKTATEDSAMTSFAIPDGSFTDTDNTGSDTTGALTFSAKLSDGSDLPSWLSFNASTRTFSGTPHNADVGTISVKVTATDTGSLSVTDTFDIVVANTNDLPSGSVTVSGTATQGNTLSASNTLADDDGMGTLSYQWQRSTNDGTSWTNISGANSTTYKLTQSEVGAKVRVTVSYTDARGTLESVATSSNLASSKTAEVANINDAPVAVADAATAVEAGTSAGTNPSGNVLTNDTDPDSGLSGETKSVSAITGGTVGQAKAGQWGSLTLNADGSYTYTVNNDHATVQALRTSSNTLTDTFTYTVRDAAGLTSTADLTVTIQGANDAPTVAHEIADATVYSGNAWTPGAFASNTFSDVDSGDTLVYSATLDSGAALPGWLSFDASTRTFSSSGVPADAAGTTIDVKVTATDRASASVSDTFRITVEAPGPSAPSLQTPTAVALVDTSANDTAITLAAATTTETGTLSGSAGSSPAGPGDTLVYGISGGTDSGTTVSKAGTYGTLVVTKATGAYMLTPNADAINALSSNASESFTVTVTDTTLASPLSASKLLTVNVTGVNDSPSLTTPATATFTDTTAIDTVTTLNTGSSNRTGTLAGSDRDTGTTMSYGITGGTDSGTTVTRVGTYSTLVVTKSSGAYTLTPNADAINALGYDASETFTVSVSDGTAEATATLQVNVTGANDTDSSIKEVPKLTSITKLSSGNPTEDTPYSITYTTLKNASDATDIDNQTVNFRIEAVSTGTLRKNGVAVTAGTTTFANGETLSWTPALNANGTLNAFTVKAIDTDGIVSSTAVQVTVDVTAVTDAPTSTGAVTANANETGISQTGVNPSGSAAALMANIVAPDSTPSNIVLSSAKEATAGSFSSITTGSTSASNGLTVSGLYGSLVVGADGSYAYTLNQDNTTVQALNESQSITDSFVVVVSDGTGSCNQTLNVVIDGSNDALPSSTNDTATTRESTALVLSTSDFGTYSDNDANETRPLTSVKITTLPSAGSLLYNNGSSWVAVTTNQEVSVADISAGKLKFVPATGASGTAYATVGFKVGDGEAYSTDANNLVIDVTRAGYDLTMHAKFWNNDRNISNVGFGDGVEKTATNGQTVISALSGHHEYTPTMAASANDKQAVDLLDAIAILKKIVGLTTLNSNQMLAADYDQNSGVDLNDAIGILKHVVGLTAPEPVWKFAPVSVDMSANQSVEVVGVLVGDVDGNWAG